MPSLHRIMVDVDGIEQLEARHLRATVSSWLEDDGEHHANVKPFTLTPLHVVDRVTDGDVGGYTDAEAEGDIRLIFTSSPPHLQAEVCERHAARDFAALKYMVMPPDIEFTEASIPRPVMDRTLTQLCASRVR